MSESALILPDDNNKIYAPLHCHTEHSVLDGLSRPSELAHRAAELGFPACAITDHGAMSGCVEFYQACKKDGIKPILGMEAYMTPYGHSMTERVPYDVKELRNVPGKGHQRNNYHCILLAKSEEGYRNLCTLHTAAYAQGYYYKPRIDFELLKQHHEGLICSNACFTAGHQVRIKSTKGGIVTQNIEDIKPGQYVLTYDNTWQKVLEPTSRIYEGDGYCLTIANQISEEKSITCTSNHEFFVFDPKTNSASWIPASKLKKNDVLLEPLTFKRDCRSSIIVIDGVKYRTKKINHIEKKHLNERVYCLNVENNHNFVCNGVIVHNCVLGEVNHHLLCEDYDMARDHALRLQDLFGEDYYFEIMNHGLDIELAIMPRIRELAKELGIKVVATNDSHFTYGPNYGLNGEGSGDPDLDRKRRMDYKLQRTMMLLGFHKSWGDSDVSGSFFDDDQYGSVRQQRLKDDEGGDSSDPIFEMEPSLYVKSYDEMVEALIPGGGGNGIAEQELANTLEVAAKCNCELPIIDPSDMSQYHTPLYAIERDIQYDDYKVSGFELRSETVSKVVRAMNEAGKNGSTLEDVLNEHEQASLKFLMWMCEKGIDERIRPKIEAKGEPLPIEFYMKNPPEGFSVVHKHNSPDESFIKGKLAEGLSPQDIIQEYFDRLDYEVSVVCRKGFLDYFSIVQQYCNYARFNDSPPGPGRGCLAPESLILLPNGQVKEIQDVAVGDVVYDEKGDACPVERVFRYDVDEKMNDITVFNAGHICLTPDHKVLCSPALRTANYDENVVNGKYVQYIDNSPKTKPMWIEAKDLHKGDWVFLPKPKREIRTLPRYDLKDFIPAAIADRVEVFDDHIEHKVYPRDKKALSARDVHRMSGVSRNALRSFLYEDGKTTAKTIAKLDAALSKYGLTALEWKEKWAPWDHIDVIPRYIEVDEDFCRFLGYFIADGNAHRGDISLYFHSDDEEYMREYARIIEKIFWKPLRFEVPNAEKQLVQGILTSSILVEFILRIIPWKTELKQIPDEFMHVSDNLAKQLLKGLIDGYGSIKDEGRVSFTSICRASVYKVRYLASSLGMLGVVAKREYADSECNNSWTIRFSTCPLLEELYGIEDKKVQTGHTYVCENDFFAMRVKQNKSYRYHGEVYDLQVKTANEPSYTSEAGIVHNSGAGALLNYLLGITSVDPLPNKLIFERFLNPDRVGYPDIDVDFDKSFRDGLGKYESNSDLGGGLKGYLREEYGADNAAGVSTFIYAWGKAALRAAARVLYNPPESVQWADELCNLIDDHPKLDLNSELQEGVNPAFVAKVNSATHYKHILDLALMLQGRITGTSIHASAFILSPHKITDKMPLTVPKAERERVQKTGEKTVDYLISYDGVITQEALGYVKLDLLCIKDLEVLTRTMEIVERVYGCKIDIENIPMDDEAVFQMLYDHNVAGIFQLDGSAGMAQVMDDVKPQSIEEMNAVIALFRPGPMDYIPNYVRGKWHPETVKYLDPRLEPILKDTYGVCCYQEEAMQITQAIAGFTGGMADNYRKQAAKKHLDQLILIKDDFISGALENGTDPDVADELWEQLVKFGSYAFNRSHSAAYAYIAYRGGFLKAHFPEAFLAAMCTIKPQMKKTDKVPSYLDEARQMGVTVKPPHVNYSMESFDVPEKGVIAFGLGGIKRVGQGAAPIIAERDANGPFKDFTDFCTRVPKQVGKAPIEALIKAGALDGLGWSRMAMEESIDQIVDFRKRWFAEKEKKSLFSDDLFGTASDLTPDDPGIELVAPFDTEYSERELMGKEKEQFGMYFDKDPRDFCRVSRYITETRLAEQSRAAFKAGAYVHPRFVNVSEVTSLPDKTLVQFVGNVRETRAFRTKKGDMMASVFVWDNGAAESSRFGFAPTKAEIKCTVFPRTWSSIVPPLVDDVVVVTGRVSVDETGEWPTAVLVDKIETLAPDADWIGASAPVEKAMEYQEAYAAMMERDSELADPSSKRYLIPAITFKNATDLDAFLLDPDLEKFRGDGRVQVSVAGDDTGSRTEVLSLKQTRGMVAFAARYGGIAAKIRLPKAQRALERRKMMGQAGDESEGAAPAE